MAKERKASVIYSGNGTQTQFSFPFEYLRKSFVLAEIISSSAITELTQGTDYTITDKQLTLTKPVATGNRLKIYRQTTTEALVEWQDASVLRSADLSLQEVQLLHLAEETADKVFDSGMSTAPTNTNVWDGQYKRITNLLDPQEDGDAVTLRYVNANQNSLLTAIKSEGAKQVSATTSEGNKQDKRLVATGDTQNSRLEATGEAQNTRVTNTGNSYVYTMTDLNTASETNAIKAQSYENLSKAWAMSSESPDGVVDNKSSKSWAEVSKGYSDKAKVSETNAKTSETNAKTSETNAKTSETKAKTSETNASASATASATSASDSAKSATASANSATASANSATAAANSAKEAAKFDPSTYYTKTETYTKTEVDNAIKANKPDLSSCLKVTDKGIGWNSMADKVPIVQTHDGVMEVGQIIAFHTKGNPEDFTVRLLGNTSEAIFQIGTTAVAFHFKSNGHIVFPNDTQLWVE